MRWPGGSLAERRRGRRVLDFSTGKPQKPSSGRAYRMCRGHRADADDALQEAYLKALKHSSRISGLTEKHRQAWLATTLTREVLQLWRRERRSRETGSYGDAARQAGAPAAAEHADALLDADCLREVCRAIARLKGRQRDVIERLVGAAEWPIPSLARQGHLPPMIHAGRVPALIR
jgi:hypothetical protein